jgi:hypothetical protein
VAGTVTLYSAEKVAVAEQNPLLPDNLLMPHLLTFVSAGAPPLMTLFASAPPYLHVSPAQVNSSAAFLMVLTPFGAVLAVVVSDQGKPVDFAVQAPRPLEHASRVRPVASPAPVSLLVIFLLNTEVEQLTVMNPETKVAVFPAVRDSLISPV